MMGLFVLNFTEFISVIQRHWESFAKKKTITSKTLFKNNKIVKTNHLQEFQNETSWKFLAQLLVHRQLPLGECRKIHKSSVHILFKEFFGIQFHGSECSEVHMIYF